eukprot:6214389-Pleurochrysis_carterae.AAC.3
MRRQHERAAASAREHADSQSTPTSKRVGKEEVGVSTCEAGLVEQLECRPQGGVEGARRRKERSRCTNAA